MKSTIETENQAPISIFIYTISEIVLPCIVLLLNPSLKLKFHIHDFLKFIFMYSSLKIVLQEQNKYIHGMVKDMMMSIREVYSRKRKMKKSCCQLPSAVLIYTLSRGSAEIGRQARLRILCPIGRVGSSPISRRNEPEAVELPVFLC